jgi:hypothetical protein
LTPATQRYENVSNIVATGKTTMEGFLIVSGTVAIIVGLAAVVEGNLGCLGIMRRKKDQLWLPR